MTTTTLVREQPVMTVKEFANTFKITEAKARNIFRASKTMRAFQMGGKWVCDYSDYLAFKERLKETGNITLCFGFSVNLLQEPKQHSPEMKLLLLNGATIDIIEEVLYGKTEEN